MHNYIVTRTRTIETKVSIKATSMDEAQKTYKALLVDGTIDTMESETWNSDDTYEIALDESNIDNHEA